MRAGKNKIARNNANTASNEIATNLNGREISQTSGHKKRTAIASGQHNTSSKHQPTATNMLFMGRNIIINMCIPRCGVAGWRVGGFTYSRACAQ